MTFYRRRLPHFYEIDRPVFLTWRVHDSLPPNRAFPTDTTHSGRAFAAMDRLLDGVCNGAIYLRQPAIANMTVEAIHYNANDCPNPVRARLAGKASDYRWSSAGWAPADEGVRPTGQNL